MPRSKRKRQSRIEFTPLPPSSPASAAYNQQIRDRAAAVRIDSASSASKRRKIVDFLDVGLPAASDTTRNGDDNLNLTPTSVKAQESDSDDSLPSLPLARKGTTPKNKSFFRKQEGSSSLRRNRGRGHARQQIESSDDEDVLPSSPTRKASDNFIDLGSANESSEESEGPVSSIRKRHTTASSPITSQAVTKSDEDSDSEEITRSSRRRLKGRPSTNGPEVVDVSSGAESTASSTPKGRRNHHDLTKEEQQEIEDDLKDLETSSSEDEPPQSSRSQRPKTERELALERLKRRRAGLSDEPEPPASTQSGDDHDEEDDVPEAPRSSARDMFAADEYDEGFLTDDGDDTLGAEGGIPLEFTRYASSKPKELFKFAIEWMVQKKLNPGFNRDDEIYGLTFAKLDDEVKGLAGSKFESSAWKPNFLWALRARPQIAANKMSRQERESHFMGKCDACNRSGHNPSYELQFQGRPYHIETLEDVENDVDSDEEDGPSEERDTKGRAIVAESHSFFVGRFCMANAETAHALQHWRYHLYEWVVEYLETEGYSTPEKIVQRDGWGEPRRRKFANKVLDKMVENGHVKKLYKDFRQEVENAREAKQYQRGSSP